MLEKRGRFMCDYPKCNKAAARLNVEIESCDGSMEVEADLCLKHYKEAVRYGYECEEKEWENVVKEAEQSPIN